LETTNTLDMSDLRNLSDFVNLHPLSKIELFHLFYA
jgi:hypothetical protein